MSYSGMKEYPTIGKENAWLFSVHLCNSKNECFNKLDSNMMLISQPQTLRVQIHASRATHKMHQCVHCEKFQNSYERSKMTQLKIDCQTRNKKWFIKENFYEI